ncbi:HIT family protein [Macrococcus brunensis]|uniref:HIT family protein n=1 Tax=Macrococcus brunensis TaxID=198483 RepID=UPI001EF07BEC|nr:HIT domain-containing protein [Macrococcus brunensis]ULG71984.1 HIT domain-containing protein [Macrococcus brunensis]
MDSCIFCSIINRQASAHVIYEDDSTLALLDIAEDVDGHTLVIPKKHFNSILDCDADTLNAVMNTVQKVSRHFTENCHYDGVNLLNANGIAADQSVPHFHIHIIPRKKNDGIEAWPEFEGSKEDIEDLHTLLKIEEK